LGRIFPVPPIDYLEEEIIIANPTDGCSTLSNAEKINGKIVLIEQGSIDGTSCDFVKKVSEGQIAGAKAVIIYNKDSGDSEWSDDLITMTQLEEMFRILISHLFLLRLPTEKK
jgi:hypothetical protein